MAEVQSRPSASRGRGSGRAGRGGYSSRGGRSAAQTNVADLPATVSLEEQGEMGQLKKGYATELTTLKELFADWTDDDLVLALEDTDGDLQTTIERISEGNVSQFSDVKKKTKEKPKARKDAPATSDTVGTTTRGRGRGGFESSRGGRGRGSERGGRGRGGRGGSAPNTNGSRSASAAISVPTTETTGWGSTETTGGAPEATTVGGGDGAVASESWEQSAIANADDLWGTTTTDDPWSKSNAIGGTSQEAAKSSLIPQGTKKSWASMLSAPKPAPAIPKPVVAQSHVLDAPHQVQSTTDETTNNPIMLPEELAAAPSSELLPDDLLQTPPTNTIGMTDPALDLTPPKDQLTEDNLEHLPDESQPIATETVASTRDASSVTGSGTPYNPSTTASILARPPMGGYATTAWKAAGTPGRSASFQKRIREQSEAVVMPSNHAVDRAAVQFGSMGLNGESKPLDVDDDREETQTRAPVADSPPSQPRASLPPASHQHTIPSEPIAHESVPTPRQAPGLPPVGQAPPTSLSGQNASPMQSMSQNPSQPNAQYGQYGRYGQDANASSQKPFDAFSQQLNYPQSQDAQSMYPNTSQHSGQAQHTQTQGAFSQGPSEYTSQYVGDQQRGSYQNYYGGGYSQVAPSQHEQNVAPQRTGSAFTGADAGYAGSHTGNSQSRFGESQGSGHTTPNPATMAPSQTGGNPQQVHHAHGQPHAQTNQGTPGYPYGNPYYGGGGGGSYYGGGSYMNQYSNNSYYGQQGYGAPYNGKGGMYGQQHHGYGMSPQTSYETSASPANAGTFANNIRSGDNNALAGGLSEYGRSGSAAPTQQSNSQAGSYSGHGGDSYNRSASGYGNQNQQYGQGQDESLKPYGGGGGDLKGGPSPSLGQPGRTSSAANNNSGYGGTAANSNYPQSQQGFGVYPNHTQGSGYGGVGGLGGNHQGNTQNHQSGGYGGGYGGFGNNNYQYGRGGWGGNNYGGH